MSARRLLTTLILLCVLLLASCQDGCQDSQQRGVIVRYRETMQFNGYTDPGSRAFGIASYFVITCISNRSAKPSDFTFDIANVYAEDSQGQARPPVTKDIPADAPAPGWTHPDLLAAKRLVPAGEAINPSLPGNLRDPRPYSFVVIWAGSTEDAEAGSRHTLKYKSIPDQPVLMVLESQSSPPEYRPGVTTADFRKGQWSNLPNMTFSSCP